MARLQFKRAAAAEPCAPARGRALRPREGAAGDRPLPGAGQAALRPRGPGVRHLPHGHREPAERARSSTGTATSRTRSCTSTRRRCATPPPTRSWRASATTPPTTSGSSARPSRSCGWRAPTRRRWSRQNALQTGDGVRAAGPARRPAARRRPVEAAARRAARHRPARTARRAAAPRGARRGALHRRRRCGRSRRARPLRVTVTRASRRAAGRSPSPAPTPRARQALRVPVRSRPSAGAERHRLVARRGRDPHHRRERRGGAGAPARPDRASDDRRHPHARRAARGAARLPVGAALPHLGRAAARARRRGRRRAGRLLPR